MTSRNSGVDNRGRSGTEGESPCWDYPYVYTYIPGLGWGPSTLNKNVHIKNKKRIED